jgi:Flp pilus assembly protein TadD
MKNRYIIIAALSMLIYLPSIFGGFMWDDEDIITADYVIHSVSNAGKVFTPTYWKRDFPGAEKRYRPMRSLLFMGEWRAFGKNPGAYHVVSIALNAAAACLALWLSLLFFKRDPDKAFVAALIFALHPAHVESVAWLKNVTDILMFIFAALAAGMVIKGAEEEDGGLPLAAAALLFFVFSLAAKENAVMLPALLVFWLVLLNGSRPAAALKRVSVMAGLSAAFLFFAVYFLRRSPDMPVFELRNSLLAFAQYSRLVFLPFDLNADRGVVTPLDAAGPLLLAALLFYALRSRDKAALYSVLWIVICLVPFLDTRLMTGRPIAEQRLYMATLGLGFACGSLYRPEKLRQYSFAAFGLVFAGFSLARNFDWIDPVRFWEGTVKASPASARARNNLGVSYERARRFTDAAKEYEFAVNLAPAEEQPYLNMADLLYKAGRREEAERIYSDLYAKRPASRRAALGLLRVELDAGKPEEARKLGLALLSAAPDNIEAINSMGVVDLALGRDPEARAAFEKAVAANPEYADAYYNLAALYQKSGKTDLAARAYAEVLRINPSHPDALNNLAIISDIAGDEARAVELFKRAEAAAPGFYQAAYNLGGIYYRKKMYIEALSEYTRVLAANPAHAKARAKADEIRKILNENHGK